MHILLLGYQGQLGWELRRTLAPLGKVTALDYPEINLADETGIHHLVASVRPSVVINATAYTAVDRAESETELATAVNGHAPGRIAHAAAQVGAALIHYSTDYVFDGTKGSPYVETDLTNPLGVYGQSKLLGEQAIQQTSGAYLILRTSWVYSLRRDSFVTKVLQWARQQTTLRVVADQVAGPTWARMLAETTTLLLARAGLEPAAWIAERRGLYHLAGEGWASRYEWARAILHNDPRRAEQLVQELLPAASADFPTPAQRPLFSALDCSKFKTTFSLSLPPWEEALRLAMSAIQS
jgi:dTDP-4-dehydrorhamnose reductase